MRSEWSELLSTGWRRAGGRSAERQRLSRITSLAEIAWFLQAPRDRMRVSESRESVEELKTIFVTALHNYLRTPHATGRG